MSIRKLVTGVGVGAILVGSLGLGSTVEAANQNQGSTDYQNQEMFLKDDKAGMIEEVEPYVYVEGNYIFLDNDIPQKIQDKYDLNVFEKHFEKLNKLVDLGKISINNDLSIIEIEDQSPIETAGLSDHGYQTENFWWGSRTHFTNQGTLDAAAELRSYASTGSAVAALAIKFPPLSFGGAITSAYLNQLANRMDYHNQGAGVIVDMHLSFTFSVNPR